jgi:UDP:flavonoid glycosyltransferase YjiC (YdhE family)
LAAELGVARPFGFQGDLFVVPFAPRMRAPEFPAPPGVVWMRPDAGAEPDPDGTIVLTLGTEFNTESGDLFPRILTGLADMTANVVVAVGSDVDPERFGPQPEHIRVERFVDLGPLVAHADVVLHHGGSGLFVRSVLGGAPQVVFPMGADQPFTADRIADLDLGLVLDPLTATPQQIAAGVAAARADDSMRKRVMALRRETLELPDAAAVARRVIRAVSALRSGPATRAP